MIVSIKVATPAKAATTAAMHPMSGIVFEYRFTSAFRFPVAFLFAFHMSSQNSSWDMSSRFFFCIFLLTAANRQRPFCVITGLVIILQINDRNKKRCYTSFTVDRILLPRRYSMSREQKIELLINLINQLPNKDREDVISLIAYTVQTREHHPDHHQTED